MSAGQVNGPVRLLSWSWRVWRLVKSRIPEGMIPVKSLVCRERCTKFVKLPISSGICPEREFPCSPRAVRPVKITSSDGIELERKFSPSSNRSIFVDKRASSVGIGPVNLLPSRRSSSAQWERNSNVRRRYYCIQQGTPQRHTDTNKYLPKLVKRPSMVWIVPTTSLSPRCRYSNAVIRPMVEGIAEDSWLDHRKR